MTSRAGSDVEREESSSLTGLSSQLLHDLRTPLNQIIGYSEMLTEGSQGQERGEFAADLQKIRAAGCRMLMLIEENFVSLDEDDVTSPVGVDADPEHEREAPAPHLAIAPGKVLIVDDDAANLEVLRRRLQWQGHEVEMANSGEEALRALGKSVFDLVLLDVIMPEMDGFEVLRHMKADPALQDLPVIMISALSDLQAVVRCIEAGAEDYLTKPFNPTLLKARIGACLEKKRSRDREFVLFQEVQENYKRHQDLEKLRDDMRNMIVHDLRTPLTAVIMGVEMLEKDGNLSPTQHDVMSIAVGGGKTLLGMINDLLDVEKMESGSSLIQHEPLSAYVLVAAAIDQVATLAADGRTALVTNIAPGIPAFSGDAGKLTRTLVNLIANAIKFTHAGTVTVSASFDDATIRFAVTDTGDGIPAEAFERIFEKFGQLDTQNRVGTGLGLAFCKLAVEAHEGQIAVASVLGVGSTFSFTIPIESTRRNGIAEARRVLVVDDDPTIRKLVSVVLEKANFRVDTAADGREALEKLHRERYDVVVMDLMMPGMTGLDVMARLPIRDTQPKFVVIMSAAPDDVIESAIGGNVFAALRKPFRIEEIVETVHACIAAPAPARV